MGVENRRLNQKKKNSPPLFSHEFFIQNHGDITSCILMIGFIGLMFPSTASVASLFVLPQYNETVSVPETANPAGFAYEFEGYRNGMRDVFTVLFYTIAWVTVHAIIQEYIIDRLLRKVGVQKTHLSKTKQTKLVESGHQLFFNAYSIAHGFTTAYELLSNIPSIWEGYPDNHVFIPMKIKYYFIFQIAYQLHHLPEFYLQKLKSEEIRSRIGTVVISTAFIVAAYVMNFNRFAIVVLTTENILEAVFHLARIVHFYDKKAWSGKLFSVWNVLFVICRVWVTCLSVLVFWHGLAPTEIPYIDFPKGNFNTSFVRLNWLLAIIVFQLVILWNFTNFHLGRYYEAKSRKEKRKQPAPVKQQKKDNNNESEPSESESAPVVTKGGKLKAH